TAIRQRESDGVMRGELTYVRRDGSRFEGELTAVEDGHGSARLIWVLIHDLTAQRSAEAAAAELRDTNEMLRALSEGAFEGVVIHSQGMIRSTNRAAERLAGVGPGGLIGRHLLDFIAPESREMIAARIATNDDRPYDAIARRDDGTLYPVEVQARTVPI